MLYVFLENSSNNTLCICREDGNKLRTLKQLTILTKDERISRSFMLSVTIVQANKQNRLLYLSQNNDRLTQNGGCKQTILKTDWQKKTLDGIKSKRTEWWHCETNKLQFQWHSFNKTEISNNLGYNYILKKKNNNKEVLIRFGKYSALKNLTSELLLFFFAITPACLKSGRGSDKEPRRIWKICLGS